MGTICEACRPQGLAQKKVQSVLVLACIVWVTAVLGKCKVTGGIRAVPVPTESSQDLIWHEGQGRGRVPWPAWPLSSHRLQEVTVCCSAESKASHTPVFPSR